MYGDEIDALVSVFCQRVFDSIPRVDQRRWAEVYLRGLLFLEGRKTVRKMAENVLCLPVNQSLQQFINQSPWDWVPIRATVARRRAMSSPSRAWLVSRATIPKRGSHSVGVVQQFVPEAGRRLNCQLGVALSLADDSTDVPVNWRLLLSGKWAHDENAREKVYLPDDVTGRPEWAEILSMVDETTRWGIPAAPLVADIADPREAVALASALTERGIDFVLKTDNSLRTLAPDPLLAEADPLPRKGRPRLGDRRRRLAANERGAPGEPRAQAVSFVSAQVHLPTPTGERSGTVVRLVLQRTTDRYSGGTWITSLAQRPLDEVMRLAGLTQRGKGTLHQLRSGFGLNDFEGRSFRGWHHHMTMVSVAWAFSQELLSADPAMDAPTPALL
ncbi:transcriptional regulator [Streptomyces sp. 3MP-14]|uniref:Transcriptional regulator n=1 Tax=Streptomyces mimosae TaxID=2586635 RepID=A0A5N6APV7_9ACTN|nr:MULTISPECIES: transposase [Streptomyces]KAB8169648.1 transcriptional regulator [Streptomyces mimosae]KAB8178396.1 transcriptional regulator [Streptomyces sp. 3MP-14]